AFGGGCCWAAARPTLPTSASASALVRTRSHRMAVSFSSAREGVIRDHLVGAADYLYVSAPPGSRTVNTEPLPISLATVTSPPIRRASLRVMARPSPVPP